MLIFVLKVIIFVIDLCSFFCLCIKTVPLNFERNVYGDMKLCFLNICS